MPSYDACRSAIIPADPQACFDALTAFEELPRWQRSVKEVTVLERDERGRGAVVAYVVDAKVAKVRYRLQQVYEEPHRIGSRYLGGDFAAMEGEWRLDPHADGTCAAFDLTVDPGRAVPAPVRRMIANAVVRGAVRDLEQHFARAAG